MGLNKLQEVYDKRFEDIQYLLNYIEWAKTNHLDIEFLDSFLDEYVANGNDIMLAIKHSAREWDL
jgi:hypothetical protein